jgi:beta-mannosidase
MEGYRTIVPRFCSEFGQQAPANEMTLERAVGPDAAVMGSRGIEHRQRATGGTGRHIDELLSKFFPPPTSLHQWLWYSQHLQRRALKQGIEWMRVQQPRCMGALVWQMNDAWPGLSWSLIDAEGHEKPAWDGVRSAFAPRIVTIQPVGPRLAVFGVNDLGESWDFRLILQRQDVWSRVLKEVTLDLKVPPRAVAELADIGSVVGVPNDPRREQLLALADGRQASWLFVNDKELAFEAT